MDVLKLIFKEYNNVVYRIAINNNYIVISRYIDWFDPNKSIVDVILIENNIVDWECSNVHYPTELKQYVEKYLKLKVFL